MTSSERQRQIVEALARVAPEVAAGSLDPGAPLRDQVDLDSMDFLRFVLELHRAFAVEIPEADYSKLSTLGEIGKYLDLKLGTPLANG